MTLDDLIARLTRLRDQEGGDTLVIVDGYEEGFQDPRSIEPQTVADLRAPGAEWTEWWAGYYEDSEYNDGIPHPKTRAVVIRR